MSSYNYENFVSLNLLLEITHNRLKWHDIKLKIQHEVTIVAIFFFFMYTNFSWCLMKWDSSSKYQRSVDEMTLWYL